MLNRRAFLAAAATLPFACARERPPASAAPAACLLAPEQVLGPYYLDKAQLRSDIRDDRVGVPLALSLVLLDARTCGPLAGAAVDVWHCDAEGRYSGFTAMHMPSMPPGPPAESGHGPPHGPPPGAPPPAPHPTDDLRFLRGVQLSDPDGRLRFTTIYPGWYPGRAVHVHLRVRIGAALAGHTVGGGHVAHTGQLYFPETTSDAVFALAPYASHAGTRVRHEDDFIFQQGGASGLVTLSQTEDGYLAKASVVVDPAATPTAPT